MKAVAARRGLGASFMADLQGGILAPVLQRARDDGSIDLQIRDGRINLYYKGLNALEVVEKGSGKYAFQVDLSYAKSRHALLRGLRPSTSVTTAEGCRSWLRRLAQVKDAIDCYSGEIKGAQEKEVQQNLVAENNRAGSGRATDYFICDVEHARTGHGFRFDALAVRWPSRPAERKKAAELGLAFVEVKFGTGALSGAAGLASHVKDVERFVAHEGGEELQRLKAEMVDVFNQKRQLGLIECSKPIRSFSSGKPELILVLVNQDPDSDVLERELDRIEPAGCVDVVVAQANGMGMGLYCERMVPLSEFVPVKGRSA